MRKPLILLAAAVVLSAGSAQAQTKKELVQKVLQLQQPAIENVGRGLAGRTASDMMQLAGAQLQRVPADKREAIAKGIQEDVRKFHDEVEPTLRKRATELAPVTVGSALEEKFTEDELKQLIAWLESPVVKKYTQLGPELEASLAKRVVGETQASIEPKLKVLEQAIVKRLGVPAGAASAPPPKKK